jgi:hypothetical protein
MEAAHTSETSVYSETTQRYVPEESHLLSATLFTNKKSKRLWLFPSGFQTKLSYFSHLTGDTCLAHLIFLDLITPIMPCEQCKSCCSFYCAVFSSILFKSSLLGPNILLGTMFLNTFDVRSSLNVTDQFSCPYKTRGKITV